MDFRQDSITVVPGRYLIDQQFLFCSLYTNFKKELGWSVVVHTCNPSYKGGEDWEDHGLRPARCGGVHLWSQLHERYR
jgi:hypothetical protein